MRRQWVALAAGLALAGVAGSAGAYITLDGDRTRWPDNPTYRILNSLSGVSGSQQAVRDAFGRWQAVQGSSLAFREVNSGGDMTVEFTSDWPREVGASAAGVTYTVRQRGTISSAEILINTRDFTWSTDVEDTDDTDIEGVMVHEIGHGIGLDHSYIREATMYWSGGSAELRDLHPDDEAGLRFLYGGANLRQGRLCDTCLADTDCAQGGVCIGLETERAFCGIPCTGGCPDGSACFSLQNSAATQCVPELQFCSDDGGDGIAQGDYCWGADQCAPGLDCLPFPGGPAQCSRECTRDAECGQGRCLGAQSGQTGYCVGGGSAQFGEPCETDLSCASLLCLPLDDNNSVCADECDPARPNCPDNATCVEIPEAPDLDGICIPGGDAGEGDPCGGADQRCQSDLTCIQESNNRAFCRAACEPFGDCAARRGCTPFADDQWFCLPSDQGPQEGQACDPDGAGCAGGLLCLVVDDDDNALCFRLCDDGVSGACGGEVGCFDIDGDAGDLGICSVGEAAFGEACEAPLDCVSFECVADGDAGICTQPCSGSCPAGWSCRATQAGGRLCFPDEDANNGANNGAVNNGEPDNNGVEPSNNGAPDNNGASNNGNNGNNGDGNNGASNNGNNGDENNGASNNGDGNNGDGSSSGGGGGGGGCQAAPGVGGGAGALWLLGLVIALGARRREG